MHRNDSTKNPPAIEEDSHIEQLPTEACWRLLQEASLGRLAFVDDDGDPEIYPVNIQTGTGSIVVQSADDRKAHAIATRPHIAVEVDGGTLRVRWSVIVHATAEVIEDKGHSPSPCSAPISWFPGAKTRSIRLAVKSITGRRFLIIAGARPACDTSGTVGHAASFDRSDMNDRSGRPTPIPSFPPLGVGRR